MIQKFKKPKLSAENKITLFRYNHRYDNTYKESINKYLKFHVRHCRNYYNSNNYNYKYYLYYAKIHPLIFLLSYSDLQIEKFNKYFCDKYMYGDHKELEEKTKEELEKELTIFLLTQ